VIRLGTRGSALARTQSEDVARRLTAAGQEIEIHEIRTAGDRDQRSRFSEVGTAGIFVREIETALLEDRIDIAVHSYKDLPSMSPEDLVIAAIPERLDPADCLIARPESVDTARPVLNLRSGSRVATGSSRRRALIEELCPDIELLPLRGNVPTRLAKLREGPADAIILAAAGLARLDRDPGTSSAVARDDFHEMRLDPRAFVPAPGQGAIAVQCRAGDAELREVLAGIHNEVASRPLQAERRLLGHVQGSCDLPFGAWCEAIESDRLSLHATLLQGDTMMTIHENGHDAEGLADRVWNLLSEGTGTS
jgi:hydroxymethylbilane synthase